MEPGGVDFLPSGTKTGSGLVAMHDVSPRGLGRLRIETPERYPDVESWHAVLTKRGLEVLLYRFGERVTLAGFTGQLWLYYRRPGGEARAPGGKR